MKLSPRFEAIISLVDEDYVADIGSDHGIVAMELVDRQISSRILATDISEKSLSKLKRKLGPDENRIDLKISDGLTGIVGPFPNLAIIAGMGGRLIIDILDKDMEKAYSIGKFILQANTRLNELRAFLISRNFIISKELSVLDGGIYYTIIYAEKGKSEAYSQAQLIYGKYLLEKKDELTHIKISKDKKRLSKVFKNLQEKSLDKERRLRLGQDLSIIEEALSYYES